MTEPNRLFERPAWMEDAACRGMDTGLFFPDRGAPTKQIKQICGGCLVRGECLAYAQANHEQFGIWGGYSTKQRAPGASRQCRNCQASFIPEPAQSRLCSDRCRGVWRANQDRAKRAAADVV